MTRYYKAVFTDCFMQKKEMKIATDQNPAEDKNYAWATGFNGCRLIKCEEISRDDFRSGR